MISIRKYLDGALSKDLNHQQNRQDTNREIPASELVDLLRDAYRSALDEMGRSASAICPAEGAPLQKGLEETAEQVGASVSGQSIAAAQANVDSQMRDWTLRATRHFQKKAVEVKDILIKMARAAESVGERDEHCARQIDEVTTQLKRIANLDDLSQIRTSIEKSAVELKTCIDRMAAEGKATMDSLRGEVSTYRARLEEAEQIASRDALTRLGNRLWVEGQIERRIQNQASFCAALIDLDGFKRVNDDYGHLIGDELLKQFARELGANCRSTDVVGRWGGDEFILLLDSKLEDAEPRVARIRDWVCGDYALKGSTRTIKAPVSVSVGIAEWAVGESMNQLLERADLAMYRNKAELRAKANGIGCNPKSGKPHVSPTATLMTVPVSGDDDPLSRPD